MGIIGAFILIQVLIPIKEPFQPPKTKQMIAANELRIGNWVNYHSSLEDEKLCEQIQLTEIDIHDDFTDCDPKSFGTNK